MSTMANMTVFDGLGVSHTLTAIRVERLDKNTLQALWRETTAVGVPENAQVRCIEKQQTLSSGVVRSSLRFEVPVMESIGAQNSAGYTAAPKVAYVETAEVVSYSTPRSTASGRKLVRGLVVNAANNVTVTATFVGTGPGPELLDTGIMPT